MNLTVTIENKGSAPFYYPLSLELGINGNFSHTFSNSYKINNFTLLPQEACQLFFALPKAELPEDLEAISVKLCSEMTSIPIIFANERSQPNGLLDIYGHTPLSRTAELSTGYQLVSLIAIAVIAIHVAPWLKEKKTNSGTKTKFTFSK